MERPSRENPTRWETLGRRCAWLRIVRFLNRCCVIHASRDSRSVFARFVPGISLRCTAQATSQLPGCVLAWRRPLAQHRGVSWQPHRASPLKAIAAKNFPVSNVNAVAPYDNLSVCMSGILLLEDLYSRRSLRSLTGNASYTL